MKKVDHQKISEEIKDTPAIPAGAKVFDKVNFQNHSIFLLGRLEHYFQLLILYSSLEVNLFCFVYLFFSICRVKNNKVKTL